MHVIEMKENTTELLHGFEFDISICIKNCYDLLFLRKKFWFFAMEFSWNPVLVYVTNLGAYSTRVVWIFSSIF